jgi:NAD(P)-dependent dehydrogenase (short-subunit alcohol dehydrogenase family)
MKSLEISGIPDDVVRQLHLDTLPLDRPDQPMRDLLRLDGRHAIVTGGGGDGLGNSVCHRLAELGAQVAVMDIDEERAEAAALEVRDRWGPDAAFAVVADVGDWQEMQRAVSAVEDRVGEIDVLVANVGGSGGIARDGTRVPNAKLFAEMSQAEIDLVVRVNLSGALYVTHAVLARMVRQGRGRIVFVASQNAKSAVPGVSVYSSCKAALMTLTQCLANEVGPQGVSTVCVSPGLMLGPAHLDALRGSSDFATLLKSGAEHISLGRPAIMDDVASVIAFLASPAGSYVHGTTVSVSGGIGG